MFLVGAWDPALGEGGTGTVTAACALPGDAAAEAIAPQRMQASGVSTSTHRQALEDALARLSAGRE